MTARPSGPSSTRSPPVAWNGSAAPRSTLSSLVCRGGGPPVQHARRISTGSTHVVGEPLAPDRARRRHAAGRAPSEFADQEAHAAGGMEMVHVGLAVGIDARQQRRHLGRESAKSSQVELDAGRRRHGDQMDREVGRAARRMQADDAVDERALVDHVADRRVGVAARGDRQRALARRPRSARRAAACRD